ncbi:hypothetical protein YPPY99_4715, partial [Yersinia pestis PY-99]
MARTLY